MAGQWQDDGRIVRRLLAPEDRLYPQFDVRLVNDAEVVSQQLAIRLIRLRQVGFQPNAIPKLPLDHGKRRFDVGALVIVHQELFPPVLVIADHPTEKTTNREGGVDLRGDERRGPDWPANARGLESYSDETDRLRWMNCVGRS